MKARIILLAVFLSLAFNAAYARGGDDCNGFGNCNDYDDHSINNSNSNKAYGGDGGNAKAYGGDGGDANVGNGLGNFSPSSKAYGGDADVDIYNRNTNTNLNSQKLYNANVGINKQGQDQDQYQGQGQGQGQGQVGIVKDGDQTLTITDNSRTEVNAEPAIAPDVSPPDPTAPCLATYGGGAAGGGVVSLGFSAYEYDEICGALEFYRVVGKTHGKLADQAVRLAHAMLLKKIKEEMGEEDYLAALGQTPESASGSQTSAMLKVSASDMSYGR